MAICAFILQEKNAKYRNEIRISTYKLKEGIIFQAVKQNIFKSEESVDFTTFLMTLSMKSSAKTCPAVLASSPVKRPIPAPSSSTDFPSYEGSKDSTYRKEAPIYQNVAKITDSFQALSDLDRFCGIQVLVLSFTTSFTHST